MRSLLSFAVAFGMSVTVAGLLAFTYGLTLKDPVYVHFPLDWLAPYSGYWWPGQYCFLGAILASVGSGLIALGALCRKPRQVS